MSDAGGAFASGAGLAVAAFFGLVFGCLAVPCCGLLPPDWLGLASAGGGVDAGRLPKRKSKNCASAGAVDIATQMPPSLSRAAHGLICRQRPRTPRSLHRWFLKLTCSVARQHSLRRFDHRGELRRAFEPGEACGLNP